MQFRKLHGAGNDFIVLTDTGEHTEPDWAATARRLCHRHTGVGADGLVVSAQLGTDPASRSVTCINADGSTATMCGNALRCVAWCANTDHAITDLRMVMAGITHHGQIRADGVWVTVEIGTVQLRAVRAEIGGRELWFDTAHTGTEHVVTIVDEIADLDGLDVDGWGRLVRYHRDLAPLGTNVNFVAVTGPNELTIRTYERGVEAETLSCGSGAVAATVIATLRGLVDDTAQITVHNRSATPLIVRPHTQRPGKTFWVGGPVALTYRGEML